MVQSMKKTKQYNDVIDHTRAVYVFHDTEPSWPIDSGANYDKNHIEQLRD